MSRCRVCRSSPCVCDQLRAELDAAIKLSQVSGISAAECLPIVKAADK